jgi:hypothetical protein
MAGDGFLCASSGGFWNGTGPMSSDGQGPITAASLTPNGPLTSAAKSFQSSAFLPTMCIAGAVYVVGLLAVLSLVWRIKKGTKAVDGLKTACLGLVWIAVVLAFVASFSTTTVATTIVLASQEWGSGVHATAGTTLQGLQWAATGLMLLFAIGLCMVHSDGSRSESRSKALPTQYFGGSNRTAGGWI